MKSQEKSIPPAESSRERILLVALPLFARHGYSGVGMREVAERSGLSKSALFHHFPTKLSLYGGVLRRALGDIEARVDAAWQSQDDPMAQLERWISVVIDELAEHPDHASLLMRTLFENEPLEPQDSEHTQAALGGLLGRLRKLLKAGMDAGRFRRVSVAHTQQSLIGMVLFHFASGDFGEKVLGESVFAPEQVALRKEHVLRVMQHLLRMDG